jgi:hypothetical protein
MNGMSAMKTVWTPCGGHAVGVGDGGQRLASAASISSLQQRNVRADAAQQVEVSARAVPHGCTGWMRSPFPAKHPVVTPSSTALMVA